MQFPGALFVTSSKGVTFLRPAASHISAAEFIMSFRMLSSLVFHPQSNVTVGRPHLSFSVSLRYMRFSWYGRHSPHEPMPNRHGPGAIKSALRCAPNTLSSLIPRAQDRKSTRLNSSHSQISYAVFCLKKKK